MSKLATKQDLNKIIEDAVKRIGKDQANIKDTKGVTITNEDIKDERKEMIEESLKAAADETAEKLVLENTITEMVKDVMVEMGGGSGFADNQGTSSTLDKFNKRQEVGEGEECGAGMYWCNKSEKCMPKETEEGMGVNESTTDLIKKLVSKKLKNISEVKKTTPSLDQVKKNRDESAKGTKEYHNEVEKKFKEYAKSDKAEENSPMHRNNVEQEEFVEDWRGMGLEDATGVEDLDRISDYLGGSSKTGNAQVDEDGNDLGNVVSTELGEKIEKKIKRKREKIETQKSHMKNNRRYSPDVQKTVNESVKNDMAKITELFNYNKKTQ
tara:strand:+ start:852 stop:1826 length:975 start_codon:yes stop_codon:yes gene_type:complete